MLICTTERCVKFCGSMVIRHDILTSYGHISHTYSLVVLDANTNTEYTLMTQYDRDNIAKGWFDFIIDRFKAEAKIADLRNGLPPYYEKNVACDPNYERRCL